MFKTLKILSPLNAPILYYLWHSNHLSSLQQVTVLIFCPGVSCCLRYKVLPTKSLLILPHSSKVLVRLPQSLVLRQQGAQKSQNVDQYVFAPDFINTSLFCAFQQQNLLNFLLSRSKVCETKSISCPKSHISHIT